MKEAVILPVANQEGYYEIRLESIGGLGANLCGKLLGELGLYHLGLNSASFSSYGSEKTGTPVKAFIRYCRTEKEIRTHAPVVNPQLLVVFHEALLKNPGVLKGCMPETDVLVHTDKAPEQLWQQYASQWKELGLQPERIYCVPAQEIAMETHSRINVVLLGAMAKVMEFVPLQAVIEVSEASIGKKYPDAWEGNLQGIQKGYAGVRTNANGKTAVSEQTEANAERTLTPSVQAGMELRWGYETAPLGGINPLFGNSVTANLAPSRQGYIPIFIKERCVQCGLCDSTCPDMVFQFRKGVYKGKEMMVNQGLDYMHCKGCLRCVAVCPVQALVKGKEAENPKPKHNLPNQEMLRQPLSYEESGADGYVTSEAYLTEKRIDGGEV